MDRTADHTPAPELAAAARHYFGDRLGLARRYAELLAADGVLRGLIGPHEAPRLWDRHLLNSVAVAEQIPHGVSVIDVGAGAGLPGVPLAIARPDLTVTLLEPQSRRTKFLEETRDALSLDNVTVLRGRAEESAGSVAPADVVTARAVAPLDRLVKWCLPLTAPHGRVLAIKGAAAAEEVAVHRAAIRRAGGSDPVVRHCGEGILEAPVRVVEVRRRRRSG